ncbi:unnamed protein product [Blepharisma stoltei]|uniref:Uncharacterized protein n=1 Tax=Blepharisma stoltei TaxID=1481888 RepID=A0AAU9JG49_9CILI|nr:unnamed protein product [Blepharisma stoltei]
MQILYLWSIPKYSWQLANEIALSPQQIKATFSMEYYWTLKWERQKCNIAYWKISKKIFRDSLIPKCFQKLLHR